MDKTWKTLAIYTMIRLLKTGELDSEDARFIRERITQSGGTEEEVEQFLALYREHR